MIAKKKLLSGFVASCCFLFVFVHGMRLEADTTFKIGASKFGDKKYKTLVLENEYHLIKIVPELGGRIVEWIRATVRRRG
jgi:hypothetical protein